MRISWLVVVLLIALSVSASGGPFRPSMTEAGQPRFTTVILTDDKERKVEKSVFAPNTPKIYAIFTLADVPRGTKLKCVWIAEKTEVAPPNYKIDEASMDVGGLINGGNCNFSKPTDGWPVGQYRVDMYLSDRLAHTARFNVKG